MTTEPTIATQSGHFYWPDGRPCYTWKHPDEWAVTHPDASRARKVCDTEDQAKNFLKYLIEHGTHRDWLIEHRPGKEVATNARHAEKYGLAPSVTTVDNEEAKPGLNYWQIEQHLDAAATEPTSRQDVSADEWKQIVKKEAQRQAEEARQKGVEIHGAIERAAKRQDYISKHVPCVRGVFESLWHGHGIGLADCDAEKSAAHPWGYGCKTDLLNKERRFIADVKCKEFYMPPNRDYKGADRIWKSQSAYNRWMNHGSKAPQDKPIKLHWPENCRQIAANAHAHGLTKGSELSRYDGTGLAGHDYTGINIYVSTSNPGQVYIHQWKEDELKLELQVFWHYLKAWQLKHYDSATAFK
jgi:hypothetical protein